MLSHRNGKVISLEPRTWLSLAQLPQLLLVISALEATSHHALHTLEGQRSKPQRRFRNTLSLCAKSILFTFQMCKKSGSSFCMLVASLILKYLKCLHVDIYEIYG